LNNWEEEYKARFISAEEAANLVKSGDHIAFTAGREAYAAGLAIAARLGDLEDVKVLMSTPGHDFGWYDAGWENSFEITIGMPTGICQQMVDERRCDIYTMGLIPHLKGIKKWANPDILLTEISAPDEKGFCSFGASLWDKKEQIKDAKVVIAEVNKNLIRTYGDNYIHFSEIDYLVEHLSPGGKPGSGSLAGRAIKEPEPYLKNIRDNVAELIQDGDTIQIGVGRTTEHLVSMGMLDGRRDLGYHSEATPQGIISLVEKGVINGTRKTLNPGKVVVTSIGGSTREEMEWVANNPIFHLLSVNYVGDIRVISAHDNMVAINNALVVDLSGQISAESLGTRMLAIAGGQIGFAFGAIMSKGGRSITVIPSTAQGGTVSRIVPMLESGTSVTLQRNAADCIVTEYGIARLRGKTMRERAEELIGVAHPDFREELEREAKRLYWSQ